MHFPGSGKFSPNFASLEESGGSKFGNPCRQRDGKFCRPDLLNEVKDLEPVRHSCAKTATGSRSPLAFREL